MTNILSGRHTEGDKPHWIEWVTGVVSAILVLAIIGWIGFEAVTRTDAEPEFSIRTGAIESGPAGHRVLFDISNGATRTAAAVVVRGELLEGGEPVDEAEITFDYVPAHSSVSGALIFATDPAGRELRIRAVGFTEP